MSKYAFHLCWLDFCTRGTFPRLKISNKKKTSLLYNNTKTFNLHFIPELMRREEKHVVYMLNHG